ncbi:MAG TPA: helix-turn-helix domain-containing protein [Candidatus Eremiobacteraceae bacterium]|nr:helix-turn-helix domain-containing protein [Candidatus Eremiobacteraceae bacterium]
MAKVLRRRTQQERTEETRSRLLKAAEKIFFRDGFEAAKLEEIASRAGYTRGAFYANFASKEDLFIAMLEKEALNRLTDVRAAIGDLQPPGAKLATLRKYMLGSLQDRVWAVLFIEFRLFALRHPELKTKLANMHRRIFAAATATMAEVFDSAGKRLPMSTVALAVSLGGLANILELDRMVSNAVGESDIATALGLLFDAATHYTTRR